MSVVMARQFGRDVRVDGSLKSRAWDFIEKLTTNPDSPGLDLKIPQGCRDKRIRTARVDQSNRAVLFAIGDVGEPSFVLGAIKPHDDAYTWAATATLSVNPANGIMEVIGEAAVEVQVDTFRHRPVEPAADPVLPFRVDELTALGVHAGTAEQAVRLTSQDALLDLALELPTWQQQVLVDLATGQSLDDVRARYAMAPVPPETAQTDEQLLLALEQPATKMDLVVVTGDAELRRMIEGDFQAWRTYLHPEQRAVAERAVWNGPFRLNGGAGTGKTVVALHRAIFLARQDPAVRVLLSTFTRNLAQQLETDLSSLAGREVTDRIQVRGLDQEARSIVAAADGSVPTALSDTQEVALWDEATAAVVGVPASLAPKLTAAFLRAEYRAVVLAAPSHTREGYFAAPRKGRRVRLNRVEKSWVWRIVEVFEQRLAAAERTTFAWIAGRAAEVAMPRYQHVIVDEGQDLHAAHWRMLRALVAPGPNDLFICEDGHQQIYGERLVLSRFGIETRGRSRRLTLNYRTTAQNLAFAMDVVRGATVLDLDGDPDSVTGYRSALHGPRPVAHGCADEREERAFVAETVRGWVRDEGADPSSVAVLARRGSDRDAIRTALVEAGLPVNVLAGDGATRPGVALATMHRAKGTEFSRVVVVGARDGIVPSSRVVDLFPADDRQTAEDRERSLFYVACSRARDQLVVTWSGTPSRFVPVGSLQPA